MKFDVIYADPAWQYKVRSKSGGCADKYYMVSTLQEMKKFKVNELSSKNSYLFMWVTFPVLKEGLELMEAWGFRYITNAFTWVKRSKNFKPNENNHNKFFFGLGYYTRGNPEICLLGKKGKGVKIQNKGIEQLTVTNLQEHSKKPDEIYEKIEKLVGPDVSKIELFARNKREGWVSLGNEIDGKLLQESIPEIIKS